MPTTDRVQVCIEHVVALITGDSELRTLMGRTAQLVVPWAAFVVDGPLPMIAYSAMASGPPLSFAAERVAIGFSVHAATGATANTICSRLDALLRAPAFAARGADIGRDPTNPPNRAWPSADPRQDDLAIARADLDLTFLVGPDLS